MNAIELVQAITESRPDLALEEHLRLALLVSVQVADRKQLEDPQLLSAQADTVLAKLAASTDQHAAMTDEIDSLAATAPCEFRPEHVWTLVRALRVQSQILNLYLGPTSIPS